MRKTRSLGFTLIELLIVIGIISILALIALPNMLEAQTRAKVARVKADMRTVAGALEMYRVDANHYPTYHYAKNSALAQGYSFHAGGEVTGYNQSPLFKGPNPLTSPIAYMSSFPKDAFRVPAPEENAPGETAEYWYVNWDYATEKNLGNPFFDRLREVQGTWRMLSPGPDLNAPNTGNDGIQVSYDPSNGTVSEGDIVRTQRLGQAN